MEEFYQLGTNYLDEENYEEAVKHLSKAAELGCPKSQNDLGWCYANGLGVAQNNPTARKWLLKAAEQGFELAQMNLAIFYDHFFQYKEAVKWFEKAAELGSDCAQLCLGLYYEYGAGVREDFSKAAYWYEKSANQGNVASMYNLGILYCHGTHTDAESLKMIDYKVALEWFHKAEALGCLDSQYMLGVCYFHGWGVRKNQKTANKWFQKAADQGHEDSIQWLSGRVKI